eukprot:4822430-Alexandrium_andersonii.AAC.1
MGMKAEAEAEGSTEALCSSQLQRPMARNTFEHEADEMATQKGMIGESIEAETSESEAEINERIMKQAAARGS